MAYDDMRHQGVLQSIVAQRRSQFRKLIRFCDPEGDMIICGTFHESGGSRMILKDGEHCTIEISRKTGGTITQSQAASIAIGAATLDVAANLKDACYEDVRIDVLAPERSSRSLWIASMAGPAVQVSGPTLQDYSNSLSDEVGQVTFFSVYDYADSALMNASDSVYELSRRGTDNHLSKFIEILLREPEFIISTPIYHTYPNITIRYEARGVDEDQEWFDVLHGCNPWCERFNESSQRFREVWARVQDSFQDPKWRHEKSLSIVSGVNELLKYSVSSSSSNQKSATLLADYANHLRCNLSSIVNDINEGRVDRIYEQLIRFGAEVTSARNVEEADRHIRHERWLNDERVNKYGIKQGTINHYRDELDVFHGFNDLDRAFEIRNKVWTRDNGQCQHCGKKWPGHNPDGGHWMSRGHVIHIDHVVPLARGGTNAMDNIQLLCSRCNLRKGDRLESELPRELQETFLKSSNCK
jgi:5-methylcytosine-specific restriction enzyme A